MDSLDQRYYVDLAAAFVRGRRPDAPDLPPAALVIWGRDAGLRIHKYKRNCELPRVRRVLGMLHGLLQPGDSLVDVGSGRGTFLWPFVADFPAVNVTAVEIDPNRARDLRAVRAGGVSRLTVVEADAAVLPLADGSADVVTVLEVLEHVPAPERVAERALVVARRAVIVSVPSRPDNNPGHIRLYDPDSLRAQLLSAGARKVHLEHVPRHLIALAQP